MSGGRIWICGTVIGCLLSACSGEKKATTSDAGSIDSGHMAPDGNIGSGPGTAELTWDAPTTNADGTTLTDLGGYRIYYGTSPGSSASSLDVGNLTSFTLRGFPSGTTRYFRVTAYDTSGNESGPSNEASKSF
jgi:hypothetical protein